MKQQPSIIPVPDTDDVTAWVVKSRRAPGWWSYTLFNTEGVVLGSDAIEMPENATYEEVALLAYDRENG